MSAPIDDGGPAFPCAINEDGGWFNPEANGMTLRDWFAGQALAGMCSNDSFTMLRSTSRLGERIENPYIRNVSHAYEIADSMLAARKEVK